MLVSELVTNSVCHSGAAAPAVAVLRVALSADAVRIEVEDPGRDGVIAPRPPDLARIGGHGLRLVQTLSHSWGLERFAAGTTRVWAQLAQPAAITAAARNADQPPPDQRPRAPRSNAGDSTHPRR